MTQWWWWWMAAGPGAFAQEPPVPAEPEPPEEVPPPASEPEPSAGDGVKLTFEGHYRIRGYVFNHLFADQRDVTGKYRDARYMQQRLWLRPKFEYEDLARLYVELRALDDIVVGDNADLASTPLFAETPSETNLEGFEQPSVRVARAWIEATLPIGQVRVGRQMNDWGMGLLANGGESFAHHFGESHYGNTTDRALFATRPVAVVQAAAGKEDSGVPLIAAVAVDRLVEDPLTEYYGYRCSPGEVRGVDATYDRRCDSDGDGVTDLDHGYTDDERTAENRGQDWWADQGDDVWEMVYILVYRGDDVRYLGGVGDLTAGAWVVHRKQLETDSNVLVVDGYLKALVHGVLLEGELISITGRTRAIALPGATNEGRDDPLRKNAGIFGYAARAGYGRRLWRVQLEHGFASGDERVTDADFTGRALNPDHNVGLLLYEEVISRVTAISWTDGARGLWSRGGVYNSRYLFPTVHTYPVEDLEILAGFVEIWPHRPDGAIIACSDADAVECDTPSSQQATASTLGYEVDLGVKYTLHEHLKVSLEAGFAKATDRLPLEAVGLNPKGNFATLQSRVAWIF